MTSFGFLSIPSAIMSTASIAFRFRSTHRARNLGSGVAPAGDDKANAKIYIYTGDSVEGAGSQRTEQLRGGSGTQQEEASSGSDKTASARTRRLDGDDEILRPQSKKNASGTKYQKT